MPRLQPSWLLPIAMFALVGCGKSATPTSIIGVWKTEPDQKAPGGPYEDILEVTNDNHVLLNYIGHDEYDEYEGGYSSGILKFKRGEMDQIFACTINSDGNLVLHNVGYEDDSKKVFKHLLDASSLRGTAKGFRVLTGGIRVPIVPKK